MLATSWDLQFEQLYLGKRLFQWTLIELVTYSSSGEIFEDVSSMEGSVVTSRETDGLGQEWGWK